MGELLRRLDRIVLAALIGAVARLGRGLRRVGWLSGLAIVALLAVLGSALYFGVRASPAPPAATAEVVKVGITQGEPLALYVNNSKAELTSLVRPVAPAASQPAEVYALVTLRDYYAPDRLTPVIGGVSLSQVYARVPLPNLETEIVKIGAYRLPDDVAAGMEAVAARKSTEAAQYQDLLTTLLDSTGAERVLRQTYLAGAQIAAAESAAYQSHCACVYAAVVRATPAALDEIASRPEVRAVDPAPEVNRLDRAVFLPPLPDPANDR